MKEKALYELLQKMTLEEKIGQLVQVAGETFLMDNIEVSTGPLKDLEISNEMLYNVGSILNVVGTEKIRKIQENYLAKNRLKIPLLFIFPECLLQLFISFSQSLDSETLYFFKKPCGPKIYILTYPPETVSFNIIIFERYVSINSVF